MRIIKFRVWDDQRKQFRDDAISFQTEENNIVEVSFENGEDHFIKKDGFISYPSSQIQQFTGLYDKNGKEIYDGDILKRYKKNGTEYLKVDVVEMSIFKNDWAKNISEKVVVGNVFENPDLVKL